MTYQNDQVQSMISEIDRILRQTKSRNFWAIFKHHRLYRQMLERCRNFLVMQQRPGSAASVQLIPTTSHLSSSLSSSMDAQREIITLEMQQLRQEVTQSLRSDIVDLGSQRTALQEEIQALMFQKAQLKADCETARTLAQAIPLVPLQTASTYPLDRHQSVLDEAELARLQALHDRTNFLLSSMDSSLQLAFTSMQKNVEVYQTTLHGGLDRMHHLGYQGEVLFSTLINRLAQQVGREMTIVLPESSSQNLGSQSLESQSLESSTIASQPTNEKSADESFDEWLEDKSDRSEIHLTTNRAATDNAARNRTETISSSMHESIDFFFADFDSPTVTPNSEMLHTPHAPVPTSSQNLRPQQVDVIKKSGTTDGLAVEVTSERSETKQDITIDNFFDLDKSSFTTSDLSEMTLAEMDKLFIDINAL